MGKLINIDNGGTLTDIWVLDGARSYHTKTITTPFDLSKCFMEGLTKVSALIYGGENLAALLQSTDHIRYSTTQGTNALVERKGPRLGLLIDMRAGIEELQGNASEREIFGDLAGTRLARIDTALEGDDFTRAVVHAFGDLTAAGAQRIVVSFSGEDHAGREMQLMRETLRMFPRHLLGAVPVLYASSLGCEEDFRRRTWTALTNAYLHPAMERFLYNAENLLRAYRMKNPLLIYRNDGYSGRVAKTIALKTYSSGPRGGMEGARVYADHYGYDRLLSMDVGGTTTDIGLVENNAIRVQPHGEVEGIACAFPLCDIVSAGVGGGSIFRVREGRICVGPDSVGGAPGPACFGMGGRQATITDALLLMGVLDPATYFGGGMALDAGRARAAIEENIARPLGIDIEAAVHDMFDAWTGKIAACLRDYTQITPDTVLAAFGGGGPLAALAVAGHLGIGTVLVPGLAAVFSAHGIGFSDIAHQAEERFDGGGNDGGLSAALGRLKERVLRDMFSEGFEAKECRLEAWVRDADRTLPLDADAPLMPRGMDGSVMIGMRATKSVNHARLAAGIAPAAHEARLSIPRNLLMRDGTHRDLPVVRIEEQKPGADGVGPALVEDAYWTCLMPEGWRFEFTANGDILFNRTGEKK